MANSSQPSPTDRSGSPPAADAPDEPQFASAHHPPEQTELSLDRLSQAFASMLGQENASALDSAEPSADSLAAATGPDDLAAEPSSPGDETNTSADAACEISPRTILEAMLFVGRPDNQPLNSEQLAGLMRGVSPAEIETLVAELNARYTAEGRPYEVAVEDAGYRLVLRNEYEPLRQRYYGRLRRARLSQAAIEVLSLVAYNEPVTADQVARLRGTPSGQILHHLVRRQLLRVERPETKPRKAQYSTTQRFLDVFRLRSLEDLPRSEELEAQ